MKKEHDEKMAHLFHREEEAKKQVDLLYFDSFLFFNLLNKGCDLGTNVSRMDGNDGKTSQ
jgi:hypothetical protein